jgi:cystathionine beta-lyase/cystathionine gamma-synthase
MDIDVETLGLAAEAVLDNVAFKEAMEEIEAQTIELWANGAFKSPSEREEAFALVRGARTLKQRLRAKLEAAKLSKAQAERRAELRR